MASPLCVFIPDALKSREQWLVWRLEDRGGKPSKIPYDAKSGCLGRTNDPDTWTDFDTAVKALNGQSYAGIGFAFYEGDELTGIDVDYPWGSPIATGIVNRFRGTYCERSPSEKLRIFCHGKPRRCGKGTRDKAIEVYDHTSPRYLTVTGNWIEGTARQITEQQEALDWLYENYFKPREEPKKSKGSGPELTLGDQDIIDRARAARNGAKFATLFYGSWEAAGYPSQSEADAALCSMLVFWTQDEGQIDRIFRQSALMREKWDERHHADGRTYGQATIERALGSVTETYRPGVTQEGPPPWEDPPVEVYEDDPECRGPDRDSSTRRGESGKKAREDSFSGRQWQEGEAGDREQSEPEVTPWPKLHEAALLGIVSEIVRAATQESEADPAAVLMTTLVAAGATIGTGPYILISDTVHHARLFSVLVGASSRARKGTSAAPVQRIFETACEHAWRSSGLLFPGPVPLPRISFGPLSSGEGLVYEVRDPVEVEKEDGSIKVVDEGVKDKRLLVIEGEFSAVLRACQREGNTLSAILRTAFDHGNIEPLTKHNRIKATRAHVNFIGHITEYELHCLLTSIDVWNGFANRILWAAVRRTRQVPLPQPLPYELLCELSERLGEILVRARSRERVILHPEAASIWKGIYEALTEDRPGALGAITSRAEALTLRLALLYSLLDTKATLIEVAHLRAALAVWDYCNDSARYLFGEADIDPQANTVIDALEKGDKTQTEINDLFSGHLSKTQIAETLRRLQAQGRITGRQEGGGRGKGKAKTIWSLVR